MSLELIDSWVEAGDVKGVSAVVVDASGLRFTFVTLRRGLAEGAVRPVHVVEVLVLAQHHHQVPSVPDQGPIQQLASAAPSTAFHDRIHSRRLDPRAG